jgi:putative hydroxymethylpyrimidine transport system substrate-binding protein
MKKLLFLFLFFPTLIFADTQKITVMLDWYPNPNHAPILLAKDLGYYGKEQLDVTLQTPTDPSSTMKLVAAKQADIGISYQPKLVIALKQGLPIQQVGTLIATPLDCLVLLGKNRTISDLKGKKIGFSDAGTGHLMLETLLHQAGLTLADVTLVNVHYSLTQALLSHKVDAVTGIMRNSELPLIKKTKTPLTVFYPEEYGVPDYSELIFITNPSDKHKSTTEAFLRATQKGVSYIINHPDQAWNRYIALYPDQNTPVNHMIWENTLPRFALRTSLVENERINTLTHFLKQRKNHDI